MGQLDQFAKDTFAVEAASVTGGAVAWQPPPELNMSEVRLDGLLIVRDPAPLAVLAAPWALAREPSEIVLEIKMQGDHLGFTEIQRALLRRQARQVQRCEDLDAPWEGEAPLWMVTSHVPAALSGRWAPERVAPGCYLVKPATFSFLWIAANELPLADELVPFLIARTGRALGAFVHWVKTRRPVDWLLSMLDFVPMPTAARDELYRFTSVKITDPEILARRKETLTRALKDIPEFREAVLDEGRVVEARGALRRVLARRKLVSTREQEARIDACVDLATLERWLEQAVDASSATAALT